MTYTLLKGGLIVTMNSRKDVFTGDLLIAGSQIAEIGQNINPPPDTQIYDVTHHFIIPGLIQTHTHLCQALFRGLADDLSLLDWLQQKIWPLEAAHSPSSMQASAQVGLLEMQLLGTTAILDMASVHHTDQVFQAAQESGIRYWGGKCLMDLKDSSGPLYESTEQALSETKVLIKKWHQHTERLNYAICPRFAVSCSQEMLQAVQQLQKKYGLLIHTHAAENTDEVALIQQRTGMNNVQYFHHLNLLNDKTVIAHGIHLTPEELDQMVTSHSSLAHCPSSNLKLASGIAHIHHYLQKGLKVGLGTDGAPCNNTMDLFMEMRLAALLQKPLFGPEALPAQTAFELATCRGAEVLGVKDSMGSLEKGKWADIVCVRRDHPSVATVDNPYSALVYSCSGRDVRHVFTHGECIVRDSVHQKLNQEQVLNSARAELQALQSRLP